MPFRIDLVKEKKLRRVAVRQPEEEQPGVEK
jgi:hypothetical protein